MSASPLVDAKIRAKAGPKRYKTAPRLTGRQRLEQRVHRLVIDAHRFARRATALDDVTFAAAIVDALTRCDGKLLADHVEVLT